MTVTDHSPPPAEPRATESTAAESGASEQRLAEHFAPCFTLVLKLRASDRLGEPDVLRRRIKALLDRTEREAQADGASAEAVRSAQFALVAFIDETILSSDWAQKAEWVNTPLQLELYDQYDAGEVFFDRLRTFLDAPQRHGDVLEVYYLCMALGFKGKYRLHEQEQLHELVETTADTLSQLTGVTTDTLSPHGRPRDETAGEVRRVVPPWVIVAAALLIGGLLYAGMYVYVSASARDVAHTIQQMGAG